METHCAILLLFLFSELLQNLYGILLVSNLLVSKTKFSKNTFSSLSHEVGTYGVVQQQTFFKK